MLLNYGSLSLQWEQLVYCEKHCESLLIYLLLCFSFVALLSSAWAQCSDHTVSGWGHSVAQGKVCLPCAGLCVSWESLPVSNAISVRRSKTASSTNGAQGQWKTISHLVVSTSATPIPCILQDGRWNRSMCLAQRWSCWVYWFTIAKTDWKEIKK